MEVNALWTKLGPIPTPSPPNLPRDCSPDPLEKLHMDSAFHFRFFQNPSLPSPTRSGNHNAYHAEFTRPHNHNKCSQSQLLPRLCTREPPPCKGHSTPTETYSTRKPFYQSTVVSLFHSETLNQSSSILPSSAPPSRSPSNVRTSSHAPFSLTSKERLYLR